MTFRLLFLLSGSLGLVVCTAFAVGQTPSATGGANLKITDDSGAPVAGATILIRKQATWYTDLAGRTVVVSPGPTGQALATADARGQASASSLEPGAYIVCITVPPGSGLVDPCKWNPVMGVTIAANQTTAAPALVLKRGGIVRVHITDASHLLPQTTSMIIPEYSVGVWTDAGSYHGMNGSESTTALGRDFVMTVPFGASLRLTVRSAALRFVDPSAAGGAGEIDVPFVMNTDEATRDFTFNVAGPVELK